MIKKIEIAKFYHCHFFCIMQPPEVIMKEKVGIYCRLSDEDRNKRVKSDDSDSIANQKSMLLKYALNHNWEVINVYSDDDYSGADINRPAFNKMINDCKHGLINIVLCKTQSRFSRDLEVIEKYIHDKFIEWGVRFVSIVDNADTNIHSNKKTRQINGLMNQWYLEDLSDNIRSSLQNRREDGLFLGSFAPYGYMKDPENKNRLIIDPVAAEVVKKIFELYISGLGYYKIAKYLNDNDISTPSVYKTQCGSKYKCRNTKFGPQRTKWSNDTIAQILKNSVYIGELVQGKRTHVSYKNHKSIKKPKSQWTICHNMHEPIIDSDTWNTVKQKLRFRFRPCKVTGNIYMLSRKVYCKECKKVFTRQVYDTKEGKTPYMKCKGRRNAAIACSNKYSIRCDTLERIIIDKLNEQLDKYYSMAELERQYLIQKESLDSKTNFKLKALEVQANNLKSQIATKRGYYRKIYEDKLNGIITEQDFIMFRNQFNQECEEQEKQLTSLNKQISDISKGQNDIQSSINIFKKYKHITVLTREIVDEFIDCIWIGKVDESTGKRNVEIEMNITKIK